MNFIPKLHILATRGQKSEILTIFGHISAILEDFLTEMEKTQKMKKVRLVDTYLECGLRFFIFSQEMPQKLKKHVFRPFWRTSWLKREKNLFFSTWWSADWIPFPAFSTWESADSEKT